MNMSIKHFATMLGVGAVVAAVLALLGVPWTTALLFAFIAACPVMMFLMMGGMGMNHDEAPKRQDDAHLHH